MQDRKKSLTLFNKTSKQTHFSEITWFIFSKFDLFDKWHERT